MRRHGTLKIISTEFGRPEEPAPARPLSGPCNWLLNRVLELGPIRASQNARLKLVSPEIGTSRHRDNHR